MTESNQRDAEGLPKNRMEGEGLCFINTGRAVMDGRTGFILCHGIVVGNGGGIEGVEYPHAWIETEKTIDGHPPFTMCEDGHHAGFITTAAHYYQLGKIDPDKVVRYTPKEAMAMICTNETYGPWDENLLASWPTQEGGAA